MDRPAAEDVTLVVASYNHEPYLVQCLESVAAQTQRPKLIVTDDGSQDNSQELIRSTLTRLGLEARTILHDENHGLCATFNEALSMVDTDFVAFISADDWMTDSRIATQRSAFQAADPEVAVVYSDMFYTSEDGAVLGTWIAQWGVRPWHGPQHEILAAMAHQNFVTTPSAMSRTQCLREVGGFDESLSFEDLDMWLKLARNYSFQYVDAVLVNYRQHGESLTAHMWTSPRTVDTLLRTYAKHLGAGAESDRILTSKLYDQACEGFWAGLPGNRLRPHLMRHAVHARSMRAVLLTLATLLPKRQWLVRAFGGLRRSQKTWQINQT